MHADDVKRTGHQCKNIENQLSVACSQFPVWLDFLQPLYVVYAWNLAHAVDDVFQMLQVSDIENDVDIRLRVRAAHLDIADVGFGVADHSGNLFQHAETIVAKNRKLDWIRTWGSLIVCPFHIDAAFWLI